MPISRELQMVTFLSFVTRTPNIHMFILHTGFVFVLTGSDGQALVRVLTELNVRCSFTPP